MKNFYILFLIPLFFVSCLSSEKQVKNNENRAPFFDTAWELVTLNNDEIQPPPHGKTPFIKFSQEGSKVNGHTGCNGFFGTFESTGGKIKFGPLGMTQMACQEWMDKEFAFITMLGNVTRYEIKGDTLILLIGNDPAGTFTATDN